MLTKNSTVQEVSSHFRDIGLDEVANVFEGKY